MDKDSNKTCRSNGDAESVVADSIQDCDSGTTVSLELFPQLQMQSSVINDHIYQEFSPIIPSLITRSFPDTAEPQCSPCKTPRLDNRDSDNESVQSESILKGGLATHHIGDVKDCEETRLGEQSAVVAPCRPLTTDLKETDTTGPKHGMESVSQASTIDQQLIPSNQTHCTASGQEAEQLPIQPSLSYDASQSLFADSQSSVPSADITTGSDPLMKQAVDLVLTQNTSSSSSMEGLNLTQELENIQLSQNNSEKLQQIFSKIQRIQTSMKKKLERNGPSLTEYIDKAKKRHSTISQMLKTLTDLQRNERLNLSVSIKHGKNSKPQALNLKHQFQNLTERQKKLVELYQSQRDLGHLMEVYQERGPTSSGETDAKNLSTKETVPSTRIEYESSTKINEIQTDHCATETTSEDINKGEGQMMNLSELTRFQTIAANWMNTDVTKTSFTPKSKRPLTAKPANLHDKNSSINALRGNTPPSGRSESGESGSDPYPKTKVRSVSNMDVIKLTKVSDSHTGASIPLVNMQENCDSELTSTPGGKIVSGISYNTNKQGKEMSKKSSNEEIASKTICVDYNKGQTSIPKMSKLTPVLDRQKGIVATEQLFKSPPLTNLINRVDRDISPSTACSSDVFPVRSSELIRRHQQRLAASQQNLQSSQTGQLKTSQQGQGQHTAFSYQQQQQLFPCDNTVGSSQKQSKQPIKLFPNLTYAGNIRSNLSSASQTKVISVSSTPQGQRCTSTSRRKLPFTAYQDQGSSSMDKYDTEKEKENFNSESVQDSQRDDLMETEADQNKFGGLKYPGLDVLIKEKILIPARYILSVHYEGIVYKSTLMEDGRIKSMGGEIMKTPAQWLTAILGGEKVKKVRAYTEVLYAGKSLKSFIEGDITVDEETIKEYLTSQTKDQVTNACMMTNRHTDYQRETVTRERNSISRILHTCKVRLLTEEDFISTKDVPGDFHDVQFSQYFWQQVDCWSEGNDNLTVFS